MLSNKEKIEDLTHKVEHLQARMFEAEAQIKENKIGLVECEICGCLLKKENADPGEKVIKHRDEKIERLSPYSQLAGPSYPPIRIPVINEEDYIHQTYYCKTHSPPKKEEEKVVIDNDKPIKVVLLANAPLLYNLYHKECPKQIVNSSNSSNPQMLPVENDLKEVTRLRCVACKATIKL